MLNDIWERAGRGEKAGQRTNSGHKTAPSRVVLAGVAAGLLTGCTHVAAHRERAQSRLREESRVLTTAVVDALNAQPMTNRDACATLALTLARQEQRIEGLPEKPLQVAPLIGEARSMIERGGTPLPAEPACGGMGDGPASHALRERFAGQDRLIAEERRGERKLVALGVEKEAERNARISFWTRLTAWLALPLGGLVALVVFAPAALPLVGRVLAWVVARLPSMAGAMGVVSVRAFDAVVRGIERFKEDHKQGASAEPGTDASQGQAKNGGSATGGPPAALLDHLSRELDADHKELVRCRREAE